MPTRCNRCFYCRSYCLLNMFQELLCPSSGAREPYTDGCCLWYLELWFSSCRYWFIDGSRTDLGTGSGIYSLKPNKSYSFSLGKFASVFLTEIYAILRCAYENIRRAYKNKQILIFPIVRLHLRHSVAQK